ncbi:hypothetical protein BGW38_008832 [Lunasporangiospora selenospora]|uniref:TRAF-type domain-containing protein n=1 Tax=Lunasporangiospora selenospora TaxID=979761 RepID=A0A9P6FXI9_9FUNG|nr:hypothetical protein BGW38_008832 [Lunasporangiospora selenospora]
MRALQVSKNCPLCRATIDPESLYEVIALSRICDELVVYCPHKSLGCGHTCQRTQVQQHLRDDCVYIGTLCRVEECRKKLLKKDLSEHMESCPYKRVDCLMCNAKVQKSLLSDHHKTCPAESVTCPHCETTRTRLRHMEHVAKCPRQIIPCSLSEFGCPWTGPRFDLEAIHIPQCPYEAIRGFLELSKSKTEALENENRQLRSILYDLRPQLQQVRDQVGSLSESFQLVTQQTQQMDGFGDLGILRSGTGLGNIGGGGDLGFMRSGYTHDLNSPHLFMNRGGSYEMTHGEVNDGIDEVMLANLGNGINNGNGNNNVGAVAGVGGSNAVETRDLLISENERIRSEIETLTAGLASLELKQNMAIMTESMRMQEEIQSLRAVCHGLRMQMHYLLLEQQQLQQQNSNNRHAPPPPHHGPPPPSSTTANVTRAGSTAAGSGRPLSTNGLPRPRFSEGLGRQETKL